MAFAQRGDMTRFLASFAVLLFAAACAPPAISPLGGSHAGADDDDGVDPSRHHPAGFAAAQMHGPSALFVEEDCRSCHGGDLSGGTANVSCNSCHVPEWKDTCTFCHGGTDNDTGAPPRDISGLADPALLTFRAHTKHVIEGATHGSYDCGQCHTKPSSALDEGHWFDDTPGEAEVTFSGLAANATYDGAGTCSTNYCHGNGRGDNGTVSHDEGAQACNSCHPSLASTTAEWETMSGDHRRHLNDNMTCVECHGATVSAQNEVNDVLNHLDGEKDVMFTTSMVAYVAATRRCTGACHGKNHDSLTW